MKTTRTVIRTNPVTLLLHIEKEQNDMMAALDRFEDSMQVGGGTRVLIKTLASGQPRPYADTHERALILTLGGHSSDGVPGLRWITRDEACVLGRIFVAKYEYVQGHHEPHHIGLEARLVHCKPAPLPEGMSVGWYASQEMREYRERFEKTNNFGEFRAPCWDYYVMQPFND